MTNTDTNLTGIKQALLAFASKRPGFDLGNYGSRSEYEADYRPVLKALHLVKELAQFLDDKDFAGNHFAGRVSASKRQDGTWSVHYTAGQYYPVEYRWAILKEFEEAYRNNLSLAWKDYKKTVLRNPWMSTSLKRRLCSV